MTSLTSLYLYNNQLDGPIPPQIGNLTNLRDLRLQDNRLSGPIPPQIGNLASLFILFLHRNQLNGSIPTEIGNLANLRYLTLFDNRLSGPIPPQIGDLAMIYLYLHNNQLRGEIPTKIGDLTSLTRLTLHNNAGLYNYPSGLADKSGLYLLAPGTGAVACLYGDADGAAGSTDCTIPTKVDQLRLGLLPTQVEATWQPHPADSTPSGYELEYSPNASTWTTVPLSPATATTATISGLTRGRTYHFRVRTTDSPTATATDRTPWLWAEVTLPERGITAPTRLHIGQGSTSLPLTWTAPPGTVTGYDIHYKTPAAPDRLAMSPDDPTTGWVAVTRYGTHTYQIIPDLTPGTAYDVRMRAVNATRLSAWIERQGMTRQPTTTTDDNGGGNGGGGGGGTRTPDDRHGNTPDEATSLNPPRYTTGSISRTLEARLQSRSDVDYFTLDLPHAGVLTATTGGVDTTGRLYQVQDDGTPVLVAEDTARGPFQLGVPVEPGTYYLAVSAGASFGAYRLLVDYTPAFVENPAPTSPQSGLGVLSGWVCAADTVEIELVPARGAPQLLVPATGTARADTAGVCGAATTATGFGLLFNWNLLGDGAHTVRVLIDAVVFAERAITVTTLGDHPDQEFRRELAAISEIPDFPAAGQTTTLRWAEALQNFVIASGEGSDGGAQLTPEQARLENPAPGSFQSGLGVISGWVCEAETVEIVFEPAGADDPLTFEAGSGTERADTADQCGDTANGFGLLFNWNLLGEGTHTVRAVADGDEFAHSTVTVTTLDGEFARGLRRTHTIADFPTAGQTTTVEWREGPQNFVVTGVE